MKIYRSLPADESDFSPPGQQQDARDVSVRYLAKSNPWIVMVSNPNAPVGLFEKIEQEPAATDRLPFILDLPNSYPLYEHQ
jgi:hypothetical protein